MKLLLTRPRIYALSMFGKIAFYIFCIISLFKGWPIILKIFFYIYINHLPYNKIEVWFD